MRDKDFWVSDEITDTNIKTNKKAIRNYIEAVKLINSYKRLSGDVLDIGSRNEVTLKLEKYYNIKIDSTLGDLDLIFNCPKNKYDFIYYNNVIEHQFNPLFTLLEINKHLKDDGILILATPLKPTWITFAKCHFHEFDRYRYDKLISAAGFEIIKEKHYYRHISINGIRGFLGSFQKRQIVSLLRKDKFI